MNWKTKFQVVTFTGKDVVISKRTLSNCFQDKEFGASAIDILMCAVLCKFFVKTGGSMPPFVCGLLGHSPKWGLVYGNLERKHDALYISVITPQPLWDKGVLSCKADEWCHDPADVHAMCTLSKPLLCSNCMLIPYGAANSTNHALIHYIYIYMIMLNHVN